MTSGKKYVDLHIHTKYSDGTWSVQEVMQAAASKDLGAVSITDHDSVDAYPQAQQVGEELGIEVVPGVELSSEIHGVDIHILGFLLDVNHPPFVRKLHEMKDARHERARRIVENLNKQGVDLRFETVLNIAGDAAIGRPHIAAAMLREELVYSFREAFDRYIGYESPAYVEKLAVSPADVFDLIREAGGVAVLAHPGVTHVDERIPSFIAEGLGGIEAYHSEHATSSTNSYVRYCVKHNLAFTGGSDFHSPTHNKCEIGVPRVPYTALQSLKDHLAARS